MKKVAILTFNNVDNYGAILQAYALQTVIKKNCECKIINYHSSKLESAYKIFSFKKSLKDNIKSIINSYSIIRKRIKFKKFKKEYMFFTEKISDKNILKIKDKYDEYIVGSDQVWNLDLTNNDLNFFLKFVEGKNKSSYAASFGFGIKNSNMKKICQKFLADFKKVYVRESDAKEYLDNINIPSKIVLDPTLLLTLNDYSYLFQSKNFSKKFKKLKKYVFVYKVASTPLMIEKAKEYAKEHNLDIIIVHSNFKNYSDVINYKDLGIEEFLYLLYNAEIVFTSSFHGLCFSIIFKKEFYFETENTNNNSSSRLLTLANCLNLGNRNIKQGYLEENMINYDEVFDVLKKERKKSIDLLNSIAIGDE